MDCYTSEDMNIKNLKKSLRYLCQKFEKLFLFEIRNKLFYDLTFYSSLTVHFKIFDKMYFNFLISVPESSLFLY